VTEPRALSVETAAALAPARLYSLEGKVAAVTGAAGGIGRWICAGLGAAGARVLATDVDEPGLGAVCGSLADCAVEAAQLHADLRDDDAAERIVDAAVERFGRIDILVNCAAVNRRMPLLDVDPDTYDLIMDIDLRLPFFLAQAAVRRMREQGSGAILNISSLNALCALEQVGVYGPAKAGLSQLTRVMAIEWAPYGIRANAIAPGFMDTPLAAPIWAAPDRRRWIINRVPAGRPGRPDELIGTALLLVSDAGSFISGQTVVVDGGFLAGGRWFTPDQ
jgi:NAD(P)-dependent dehydrogenase (short-subunit alcohol dehydrogenase family)